MSVNTFSKDGRLYQIEYALEAMKLGQGTVGIKVKEGIVLAVERRLQSSLMIPKSLEKISEIDTHIAAASSGLITDARILVDHARVEAQNHTFNFNEPISVRALTQSVSDLALNFGESDGKKKKVMSRPFGVGLLIGGITDEGPKLYQTDPSGTMIEYQAKGLGSAAEGIQSKLQESYKEDLTLEEAENLALLCLKQVMEEKIDKKNVELCVIPTSTKKFTERNEDYIDEILKKLP
ncbi:hypothetical protein PPERSA_01324 [Pseudocohnilembus persalinus]|uniref:Proteasome alpha-type subunits domain-containing protein n=1 Tax=Pseudocohnilembus persalinus TaxID=266149 RepID=A0A0V0QGR7_PSEPJ|nr:hypothetical protein PPERSA_01324 [Pseudocohnilembus persalinus]|eukprot:KRX01421.1 hypothetical protein PPERSA_01324 [Pseudocohnilembus persalinus]